MKKIIILLISILSILLLLIICGWILWDQGEWKEDKKNTSLSLTTNAYVLKDCDFLKVLSPDEMKF